MTELLGEAYGSAGAGEKQFEKTQESLETKLNNLKTAWTQFTTSIANSDLIKTAVDALTLLLNTVNKLTDSFGSLSGALKLGLGVEVLRGGGKVIIPALRKTLKSVFIQTFDEGLSGVAKSGGSKLLTLGDSLSDKVGNAWKVLKESMTAIDTEADVEKWMKAQEAVQQAANKLEKAKENANLLDSFDILSGKNGEALKDAAELGAEEGLAEAKARAAAVEAHNGKSLPKRIAESYKEGREQGKSWGAGFSGAAEEVKKTKLVQNLASFFSTKVGAAIGVALVGAAVVAISAGIAYLVDPVQKLERKLKKIQEEIDANNEKIDSYNSEIAELEAQEQLTAAEKTRLKWLKLQTEELEKQNKERFQDQYEEWKKSREKGVVESRRSTPGGRQFETYTPSEYIDDLEKRIKDYNEQLAGLDVNDSNYQLKYNELTRNLQYEMDRVQEQYDQYSEYASLLDGDELTEFYRYGKLLGRGFDEFSIIDPDAYNEIMDLAEAGDLTSNKLVLLSQENEKLQAYFEATGASAIDLANDLNVVSEASEKTFTLDDYKKAAEQLKNVKKSVNAVSDAFSSLYKDGYVDIDKLSDLANDESFAGLDSFVDYLDLLGRATKESIPEVAEATGKLLDEFMNSSTVMANMNSSTVAIYENILRNAGATNAHEVASEHLKLALGKQTLAQMEANEELIQFSGSEQQAEKNLEGLAKQLDISEQAVAAFTVKAKIANANYLTTKMSREELGRLISSLGLTTEAMRKYNSMMSQLDSIDELIATQKAWTARQTDEDLIKASGNVVEMYRKRKDELLSETKDLLSTEIDALNLTNVSARVDPTQFDNTSSSTEKEIQKLSELYNAKKKVAAIEEKLSDLEEKRNVLQSYDAQRANENEQIKALEEQFNLTKDLIAQNEELRKQKLAAASTDWTGLYTYNELTHELELSKEYYNAINKNGKATKNWSADVLNNFKKWVEEYDDILDFSTEQENVLDDINTKLQEIWEGYRDNYIDLVNELAELFEQKAQKEIDTQKDKYDKMKDLDDKYLDELRKNIEARRDARDRENDVEDIAKKQKRLNMLMRDTSGRNASEIADLQKEIADAQQDLIDDDVDRVLDSLEDANDQQQENWDNAIEKLEDQLDQDKENGKFIRLAEETLQKTPEEIKAVFKDLYEEMDVLSQAELEDKLDDVTDKLVGAIKYRDDEDPRDATAGSTGNGANGNYTRIKYLDTNGNIQTGYVSENNETYKDKNLTERIDQGSIVANENKPGYGWKLVGNKGVEIKLSDEQAKALGANAAAAKSTTSSTAGAQTTTTTKTATISGTGGKGLNMRSAASSTSSAKGAYTDGTKVEVLDDSNSAWWKVKCKGQTGWMSAKYLKYAQGGLVDYTGPAWVDGNPSKPEAFLNAQDTKNFTELKELLASLLRENSNKLFSAGAQTSGDCNIYITVDQIASDYDIDEAVARVKQEIMSSSNYRNVNLINRRR